MLRSRLKFVVLALFAVSVICGTSAFVHQALADKPGAQAVKEKLLKEQGKDDARELTGMVQTVDAGKSALTITGKQLGSKTFEVAKEARIYLDDGTGGKLGFKDGKFSDIVEGLVVTVRLSEDGKSVVGIWAEGPSIRAEVKAVSPTKRTITVTIVNRKDESAQEKTFEIAPNAAIVIHDAKRKGKGTVEASGLADVPVGAFVTLKLSADQKLVGSVQAEGAEVQGFVKAVDGGKNTITVSTSDGKQTVEKTFNVLPTAAIAINDGKGKGKQPTQTTKLADLPVGAQVTLKLTLDQKAVVSVSSQGISVSGIVKAVDAGKNNITLELRVSKGEPAEEKTFAVATDAYISIDGKEAKLADLPTDAQATVKLHADHKTVGSIHAEGQNTYGIVKAVDASQGTITLEAGKSGEERTLAVSKDAQIVIDGKAGKLADVPTGSPLNGKMTVDQKSLVSINVSGPSLQGVVKAVDIAKGKITATVVVRKGDSEEKVFDLAKDVTVVTVSGKTSTPLKLADLKTGKDVVLQLTADQKTVLGIRVVGD